MLARQKEDDSTNWQKNQLPVEMKKAKAAKEETFCASNAKKVIGAERFRHSREESNYPGFFQTWIAKKGEKSYLSK